MGIYLPNIEMPKEGCYHIICIYPDGTVPIEGEMYKAIPVPPHGDLIDRDAARGSIKPWSPEDERNVCTFDTVKKLMYTMLDRAPTIIPVDDPKEEHETDSIQYRNGQGHSERQENRHEAGNKAEYKQNF